MLDFLIKQIEAPITGREVGFLMIGMYLGMSLMALMVNRDKIKKLKISFLQKAKRGAEIMVYLFLCVGLYTEAIYYGFRFNIAVTPHNRKKFYFKTCKAVKCLERVQWKIKGGR